MARHDAGMGRLLVAWPGYRSRWNKTKHGATTFDLKERDYYETSDTLSKSREILSKRSPYPDNKGLTSLTQAYHTEEDVKSLLKGKWPMAEHYNRVLEFRCQQIFMQKILLHVKRSSSKTHG